MEKRAVALEKEINEQEQLIDLNDYFKQESLESPTSKINLLSLNSRNQAVTSS